MTAEYKNMLWRNSNSLLVIKPRQSLSNIPYWGSVFSLRFRLYVSQLPDTPLKVSTARQGTPSYIHVKMNVFTLTRPCRRRRKECTVLKVDLDRRGQLDFRHMIRGSERSWRWNKALAVKTWYDIEIKQHMKHEKVNKILFHINCNFFVENIPALV